MLVARDWAKASWQQWWRKHSKRGEALHGETEAHLVGAENILTICFVSEGSVDGLSS